MRRTILALAVACVATATFAHDFTQENAKFQGVAATRDMNSPAGVEARVALERANAEIEQGDVRMLLKIRSMTNDAFKAVGGQPAFLTSEIKRLEEVIANPKDASGVAKAKDLLVRIKAEKAAYDVIDKSAGENMKRALELIEKAQDRNRSARADLMRVGCASSSARKLSAGSKGRTMRPRCLSPLAFTEMVWAMPTPTPSS
eukprot:gene58187-77645_t